MKNAISIVIACAAASALSMEIPPELRGENAWGGRERHPAVVNSVLAEPSEDVLSLRGTWEFGVSRRNAPGLFFKRMVPKEVRPIEVPGCWEAQGVGEEGTSSSYVCRDNSPKPMRHVYEGLGVYRKCVDIPAGWAGKRIWIKAGYIWSQGWIRVNDNPVAWVSTYCGTYKWEITDLVNPGEKAEIVVVADNAMPNRAGAHYGSGRFGGIVRDIELEATPQVLIDDAWVKGDFDRRRAEVHVAIEGSGERGTGIKVTVEGEAAQVPLSASARDLQLEIPLRNFRAWSPEAPNLYTAKVELVAADGRVLQMRKERFGVRKFEIRGKEIYLNGRAFFFRGFGDNHPFPVTGATPADRAALKALLGRARAAGFNYVRTHTYCPFPEYFEAADELGIIVQPELPYYGNATEDGAQFDPLRDVDERWRHFRRYVSWGVASQGNEGLFCDRLRTFMYRCQKDLDPDRLVTAQDGAGSHPPSSGEPYTDFHRGARMEWERGSYNAFPFVCHEYLNLTVKSDAGIAADYTGLWLPPETPERRAAFLEKAGLSAADWSDRLQLAQHGAQAFWVKYGLEQARLDPYCDGYCYWTIADTTVFNPKVGVFSAQGVWDPFWRRKRGSIDAADIAVFNSPACLLMLNRDELPKKPYPVPADQVTDPADISYGYWKNDVTWPGLCRVYRSGDTIPLEIHLAQYGERALPAARLVWKLTTTDGRVLASSSAETPAQPIGPERRLVDAPVVVPALKKPVKAVFSAALEGTDVPSNAWTFWLFPKRERMTAKGLYVSKAFPQIAARYDGLSDDLGSATTVLAPYGSTEAQEALAAGKNLVTLANVDTPLNVRLGWWDIGKQCGTAIRESQLLAGLPQESQLTPLLMRIFRVGTEMPVAPFGSGDAVIVCEGGTECRLYLAERLLPNGARHVFLSGLDVVSDTTEGVYLLDSILVESVKKVSVAGGVVDDVPGCSTARESRDRKIRVACIGDSITWGTAMTNRVEECYPAQLQRLLGDGYEVRNFGNGGSCVYSEPKKGPSGKPHPWRSSRTGAAAYAFKPDIVVSGLGANDMAIHMFEYIYDENGIPKTEPGLFRREYIEILNAFKAGGCSPRFIVWTKLTPLGKKHVTKGKPDPFVLRYDLEAVARAVGAVELDMYTPLVPYAETEHYAADGVHPEGGAQRVIAEITARKILESAGGRCTRRLLDGQMRERR